MSFRIFTFEDSINKLNVLVYKKSSIETEIIAEREIYDELVKEIVNFFDIGDMENKLYN